MGNCNDVTGFYSQLFNFLAEVTGPLVASQIAAAKAEESENRYDDRYENTQSTTRVQAAETVRGAMTVAVVLGVSACLALEVRLFLFLHMRNWYDGVFFNTARRRKRAAVVGWRRLSLVDRRGRIRYDAPGGDVPSSACVVGTGGVDRYRRGGGVQGFIGHKDPVAGIRRCQRGELG